MKRTTKQTPEPQRQPAQNRTPLTIAELAHATGGDCYMQNPRGSNDRDTGG